MRWLLLATLLSALAGTARAQGVGVPSSRWGIGFGNSPEFTGLRFNFRDNRVKRIDGVNLTLWQPHDDDANAVVNGVSFGPLPGGGTLRGLQLGLFGVIAMGSMTGLNVATFGMGAGHDVTGINIAGLGMGAGGDLTGFNFAVLGVGAGGDLTGITLVGLGAGAGGDVTGLNIAGLGMGAGGDLAGINLAGLGLGAGGTLLGLSFAGLGVGGSTVKGLALSVGVVGGERLVGVGIAGLSVHVIKGGEMRGLAVSAFNYIKGSQTGVAIGIVNYAWSVRGVQLGLVNIVRDNPAALRVLPVFNTSF